MSIQIRTDAFAPNGRIPRRYTRDGENVSPPLRFENVPPNTRELALIVDDPDAPGDEPFVHWVAYHIPPDAEIPEGVQPVTEPNTDAVGAQGRTSRGTIGYDGPAPPPGHGVHHYRFHVYALDRPIAARGKLDKERLIAAMAGHILDEGELIGTYERPPH